MYIPYVVQPGDSLYFIARMFGTTVEAIMAANRLTNPAMIFVGQVLYIPVGQPTQPPVQPPGTFPYVVQPGDTLYFIAQRFNTTVETLMQLNNLTNPDLIFPGQVIWVPVVTPTTMPPTTMPPTTMPPTTMPPTTMPPTTMPPVCGTGTFPYTVQVGDTLFFIAQRFGVTVQAILAVNPQITDPTLIFPGQVICIPQLPPTTMPPTTMPPTTCPAGSFAISLQPGDTLYALAQRIGSTVEAILKLNPGLDPNNIRPGQMICIPYPQGCPTGSTGYIVKAGDTLYLLAQRFGVPSESIVALNPGVDWANLQIGQTICIPNPVHCPPGSYPAGFNTSYTLAEFAALYHTTVEAILAVNPGLDPNNLKNGQIICIPQTTPTTMPPTTMPPTTMPPGTCPVGSFSYIIQAGDTFFLLAQRFGTSVTAIQALNPKVNPNNLQIGQVICIPNPVQCPVGSFPYQIKSGDTLFALARQFGTTVEALQALNPGLDPLNLQVGQTICIPKVTPTSIPPTTTPPMTCPAGSFAYRIKAGDTFFLLAQRFATTVEAIRALNPTVNPDNLQVGQIICIPEAEGSLPPGVCPEGSFVYTVQSGDTYFVLAQRFGTTVEAIARLNPNVDPEILQVGAKICIPGAPRSGQNETVEREEAKSDEAKSNEAVMTLAAPEQPAMEETRQCPAGSFAYTIQAGDTFFALAEKYGVTAEQIQMLNPTANPDSLQIGQVICIPEVTPTTMPPTTMPPTTQPPVVCPVGSFAYTIKAGDNFYALAIHYGTTAEAIQALNPNANPYDLKVGQVICIPQVAPTVTPTTTPPGTCQTGAFPYTVRAGDTYFLIARRFGTTVEAIQAANPTADPNNLKIGQIICVPGVPGTTMPPTTQPPATFRYVVQVGDTLFFIARRFGTTVEAILKLNPQITDPSAIFPGQVVLIPQPARS